jgi:hypothetical protein
MYSVSKITTEIHKLLLGERECVREREGEKEVLVHTDTFTRDQFETNV